MTFGELFAKVRVMERNEPKPDLKPITQQDHEWADRKIDELIEESAAWSDTLLWWAWNMGWLSK